ncbi:unnamed protein product [Dovyalis caffra]|uniref:Uncharacterized protein n=1 Tax=Dovyalis caffra TaxID=77055 RepID=A0AAV1RE45_9ROSI|nr:unnamed protein product [Dovyalis caffra]
MRISKGQHPATNLGFVFACGPRTRAFRILQIPDTYLFVQNPWTYCQVNIRSTKMRRYRWNRLFALRKPSEGWD